MEEGTKRRRPFGLYVIIGLLVLNILAMFADVVRVQSGMTTMALPNLDDSRFTATMSFALAIVLALIVYGLWRYKYWAWYAIMIVTGIALLVGIGQYFNGGTPYVNLLINSVMALYLNQRQLRLAFAEQHLQEVTT